jgi:hypothetical protein
MSAYLYVGLSVINGCGALRFSFAINRGLTKRHICTIQGLPMTWVTVSST